MTIIQYIHHTLEAPTTHSPHKHKQTHTHFPLIPQAHTPVLCPVTPLTHDPANDARKVKAETVLVGGTGGEGEEARERAQEEDKDGHGRQERVARGRDTVERWVIRGIKRESG